MTEMQANEHRQFELLVHKVDPRSKLLHAWPLTGGVSAQITALEILRSDGRTDRMVARRAQIHAANAIHL